MARNRRTYKGITGIEYLVLIAVIIGAALLFLGPLGPFQTAYDEVLSSTSSGMMNMADQIAVSMRDGQEVLTVAGVGEIADNSYLGGGDGGGEGSSSSSGGGSSGGSGGSGGGGSSGGSGGSSGGSSGGGGGSSGGGGNSGGSGDVVEDKDNSEGDVPGEQTVDTDIATVLDLLNGAATGQYYFNLINAKKISVIYDDFSKYPVSDSVLAFWWGPINNTIYVNQNLQDSTAATAIAAIIAHEATHADYSYNPEKVIAETLDRHPELIRDDLNIDRDNAGNENIYDIYDPETGMVNQQVYLLNSIDQEYVSFANELEVWKEIRGSDENIFLDFDLALYEQGEDVLKANLRTRGSYATLPEY